MNNPAGGDLRRRIARSWDMYQRAREIIAGGTQLLSRNPEMYAYGAAPIYAERADGGRIWDIDGNEYVDMMAGIGAYQLGYAYPAVEDAVRARVGSGPTYSVNHPVEVELAEELVSAVPCAEMVRYAKGGGDATAVAVRIARGFTGRDKVLFCGYHGWHDWYIAANLASPETLSAHLLPGVPSAGVPKVLAGTAIPFEYNNLDDLRGKLEAHRGEIACVIMEPCNSRLPNPGFLEGVRELTLKHGVVLLFDEVNTGFRLAPGGAQEFFGVKPDMAAFAKALGNGYPAAAVCGKREIMSCVERMFVSSTFWHDTVSLAAALAVVRELKSKPVCDRIREVGEDFSRRMNEICAGCGLPARVIGPPAMSALALDVADAMLSRKLLTLGIQEMVRRGVFWTGAHKILFTHTQRDLDHVLSAAEEVFAIMSRALREGTVDDLLEVPPKRSPFERRLV
ncbi:MAG TPA: aminotransferase class III-fold pyridoxal phosphate-dependent enzyme [Candidatus Brocadiia bacterium]|nr:aminotransferase class III-fold pyridoxal phosphate-dependent enzyme [Candidatus Brocadiia bacterium]